MDASNLKKQAQELSGNLRDLGSKKEQKYKEKNRLDSTLNRLIKEATELRERKNEISKKITGLKKARNDKNKAVRDGLRMLKTMKNVRKKKRPKDSEKIRQNLTKEIENLNFRVETESLGIKKEREIMNKIKLNKSKLSELEELMQPSKEYVQVRDATKALKKESDHAHLDIQKLAKESSKIFDRLTELSKQISEIKRQRNLSKLILTGLKDQINTMNAKLGGVLRDMTKLPEAARKHALDMFKKEKLTVKEVIKSGKKLSKDDILKLQRGMIKK
tara:strand:+ start:174 stop:998 length:825 start_codon:yes stop_codon:yes gene_type:complete